MVPRIHDRGKSFKEATNYILHDQNAQTSKRVEWTHTVNLGGVGPDDAWRPMYETWNNRTALKIAAGVDLRGRDNKNPVFHYTLSWHPEDKPSREHMTEAALSSLKALKLEAHQALMAAHNDTEHPHVHIIVNTVHPETGRTAPLKHTRLALSRWAEEYERAHGIHCEQRIENNAKREIAKEERKANRPIEGSWPYLWIDATYVKVRQAGRIVSVAVIIAVAVNTDGRREVLGLEVGPSEAEPFWTSFLRSLTRRGLRGVKLVISDSHEGLKKAAAKVLTATWQRCRVHFMRNALAHVGVKQRPMVAAAIRTAFTQETQDAAKAEWRAVADRLRERFPKLGQLMDEAEDDVLAHLAFPKEHWPQLHSTNPLERLNGEIKRRTDVVAIFPNEAAIVRLVGAMLLEQNDEWAASRSRYMTLEKLAQFSDDPQARPRRIPAA